MKKHKVFYGWWIVGALLLISAYIQGIITFGFTAIFDPIANEFGWSYAQVSLAASIRGLETGLLAPLVGVLVDRLGARKLVFTGILITGLGLVLLSRITSLVMFYGVFILIASGMSTCLGVLPMTVVGNWFRSRVSIATGIVVSGVALGGLLVQIITRLIDIFGWRTAMIIFGLGAWIILLPLSLIIRHKPEQYGYLPDGDLSKKPLSHKGSSTVQYKENDIEAGKAFKSGVFWHISLSLMCHVLVINAVLTHIMPYLSTIGIARSTSSMVASALPITSILGRLSFGWFGDRFNKKRVTAVGFILTSLSMLLFGYVGSMGTWLLPIFLILFGVGYGGPIPMIPALFRESFGRASLGAILGFSQGITVLGTIIGPPLAGWVFDSFGNYQGAWFAFAGVTMAGLVILMTTPPIGESTGTVN
ncbi:MFS transporter [Thermodesulfobacteriota bacterium]